MSQPCTCLKDGSARCLFPHQCRRCYGYHPGVSCYWNTEGKMGLADAPPLHPERRSLSQTVRRVARNVASGIAAMIPRTMIGTVCPFCLGSGEPGKLAPKEDR